MKKQEVIIIVDRNGEGKTKLSCILSYSAVKPLPSGRGYKAV